MGQDRDSMDGSGQGQQRWVKTGTAWMGQDRDSPDGSGTAWMGQVNYIFQPEFVFQNQQDVREEQVLSKHFIGAPQSQ